MGNYKTLYTGNTQAIKGEPKTRIVIYANGQWEELTSCGTTWESALAVWEMLKRTYYPDNKDISIWDKKVAKIWELHKNKNLSTKEYISLLTTLDPFLASCREIPLITGCLRKYGKQMSENGIKNSLEKQADMLEELKKTMWARDIKAIGWEQNTQSGMPWSKRGQGREPYNPLVEKKGHIWCKDLLRPKDIQYL